MVQIDVLDVLKKAIGMSMGADYYAEVLTAGTIGDIASDKIVDMGKDITDSDRTAESFYGAALSVISDIVVDARAYTGDLDVFMVKDYEWGGFIERIKFGLANIVKDPKWNLAANAALETPKTDYSKEENSYYPIPVTAKIFDEGKAIMCPISKPADQLKEAFTSAAGMTKFFSGIAQAVENSLNIGLASFRHMMAQCGIALSIGNDTAVHLITDAVAEGVISFADGATADQKAKQAMNDPDFLTYMAERIAEVRDNVKVMSSAYIPNGEVWFSPDGYDKLVLLSYAARKIKFGVKANTFNKDEIGFGDYSTTPAWQGIYGSDGSGGYTAKFNFKDASTVSISRSSDAAGKLGITFPDTATDVEPWTQNYVVGLLFDKMAMGICPYKKKVTSKYIASGDFFNEFHHLLMNCLLDASYPVVAFVLD